MQDVTPILLGVGALLVTATLTLGLVGRRDQSSPRCAACGADARPALIGEAPTCRCGARLDHAGGLRVITRRSRRSLAVGVIGLGLLVVVTALAIRLYARGQTWRETLPDSLYVRTLGWGFDWSRGMSAVSRRLIDGMSPPPARVVLSAALDVIENGGIGPTEPPWNQLPVLVAAAKPDGPLAERSIAALAQFVEILPAESRSASEPARQFRIRWANTWGALGRSIAVRIDGVSVNGQPIGFQVSGAQGWRELHGTPTITLEQPIEDPTTLTVALDLVVVFPRLPADADALFAEADPAAWGLPFARSGITVAGRATAARNPGGWVIRNLPSWGRWDELLGPGLGDQQPKQVAMLWVLPELLVGGAAGILLAAPIALVTRRFRPPPITPPACPRCHHSLRGAGRDTASGRLPERCPECGRAVRSAEDLLWTGGGPRRRIMIPTALLSAIAVGVLIALYAPASIASTQRWITPWLTDARRIGQWYAHQAMRPGVEGSSPRAQFGWGEIYFPMVLRGGVAREASGDAAAAAVAETVRLAPSYRSPQDLPRAERERIRIELARAAARAAMEQDVGAGLDLTSVRAAVAALLEETIYSDGSPLAFPRCVRVGEPMRMRSIERTSDISVFLRRLPTEGEEPAEWGLVEKSDLDPATEPGRRELTYEWALVFPAMSEQFAELSTPEIDRRLRLLPFRGQAAATITVVPADTFLIDDPSILRGEPPTEVSLQLTRLGDRTEVMLEELRGDFILVGTWEIHGVTDAPIALRRSRRLGSHFAMVSAEQSWPERLELRFRPEPVADPAPEAQSIRSRGGFPALRWNAPWTLTVRREPAPSWRTFDDPEVIYRSE
jgi:hypothetical protein